MIQVALAILCGVSATAGDVDVFTSGKDGYVRYRIPAIVASTKRTLLAFCEGRKEGGGDAGNIDLLVRRSTDQGKSWSESIGAVLIKYLPCIFESRSQPMSSLV